MPKRDIETIDDIRNLVDGFYGLVREDELLAPIFTAVIQDNWPVHLEKMYRFWQTVLLGEHTYFGGPFPPHAKLPVYQEHFDRWLQLWTGVVNDTFEGPKATEAIWRAGKMATMFISKIDYYRNSGGRPLI